MYQVCIDARMLLSSGIGTYLRSLLPLLAQGPFYLRLIVHKHLVQELPWLSRFSLEFLEAPIYSLKEQLLIPRIIGSCDLFFSPHYNVPLFPLRARRRLVTIHDVNHLVFSNKLTFLQKNYARFVLRQAVARSTKVITVSEFSKRELCKYLRAPSQKIQVIPPGVDRQKFLREKDGRALEIKKRYLLPENYFLFVGNFKPHKNLIGLIRAYELAGESLLHIPLVVVGRRTGFLKIDRNSQQLIEQFVLLQKIFFLDFVAEEDLPTLYHLATATIIPSLYEGFGSIAVEAMSAGSPLAVSHVASLPEVCEKAALYFNPHEPQDIARALIQLASHPELRDTLMEKGLAQSQKFLWEQCAADHIRVMENLCKR